MLFPLSGIPVVEYDATFTVSPTSRGDHHSDTVLASVEMLVRNDAGERLEFPFMVLSMDSGEGAAAAESVTPKVYNGSTEVTTAGRGEVDEQAAAEAAAQRVAAGGGTAQDQQAAREFVRSALASAERRHVGRTHIEPGQTRRILAQQRLRVLPEPDDAFVFKTVAPSPLLTTTVGGRVSAFVWLPFEDEDVRIEVLKDGRTQTGFDFQENSVRQRKVVSWYWRNDPVLTVAYRYL